LLTVILNPASGNSKTDERRLTELFLAEHVETRTVQLTGDDGGAIIRNAVADSGDAVVAVGGDGTVSSVASALAGSTTPLGIVPAGTLNHFAKTLGIPIDIEQAVKIIAARHVAAVDLGVVNDRAFINNSSIGVYPGIVEMREELRRQGHPKWIAMAMASIKVLDRDIEVYARLEIDGKSTITRTPFVFIGNNEYTEEGIHLGSRARIDQGRLYAYFAHRLRTRDLPAAVLRAIVGRAPKDGTFIRFAASEIWIETPASRDLHVAIDGEVAVLRTPLHYRIRPRGLQVIVPR
jgi:diacylglycerol kinase family enzyme